MAAARPWTDGAPAGTLPPHPVMTKRPLLRIFLIVLLVLVLLGGFAFRTFLFDPFEGPYTADVSTLVPRDVDFFVAKAELERDFGDFPRLAVADAIEGTAAWRTFERTELPQLDQTYGITEALAGLADLESQLRGLELLSIFGGEDVALAGYFRGPDLGMADWAAYGRVNWAGKIGTSALRFPGLIGLENQGITATVEEDHVALSGGQLARPMYVARVRDVAVLGTSLELVRKALDLDARKGVDSFGQSAKYFDHIENADRGPRLNETELYFDWRAWSENAQLGGRWPDPDSQDFLPRLLARLFQAGSVRDVSGVLGFDGGVTLDLHGELSSELMTTVQRQMYRQRGVDKDWYVQNVAKMVRADAALFIYLQVDIADLLRELFLAADVATRSNIEDLIRAVTGDKGAEELITELGALFKDRVAIVVRENTYRQSLGEESDAQRDSAQIADPPHNGEPVPAIAVMLWTDGSRKAQNKLDAYHQLISRQSRHLQLSGPPGTNGVFTNSINTGHEVWEFWSQFVSGTGHIATVYDYDRYVITNHFRMIEDLMRVLGQGGARYPRLSERPEFRALMEEADPQANAILWYDPAAMAAINGPLHQREAEFRVLDNIDWNVERASEEARLVRDLFPGEVRGSLNEAQRAQLNEAVTARLQAKREALMLEQVPAARAELQRRDLYLSTLRGVLVMLSLDQKFFDIKASALIPLEAED